MILAVAIVVMIVKLLITLTDFTQFDQTDALNIFLGKAMTLAVGVEFIKMLCKHSPATVIEVLLFAIARQMVVEHADAVETLIGVAAIAVLFAVRRYLFTDEDRENAH